MGFDSCKQIDVDVLSNCLFLFFLQKSMSKNIEWVFTLLYLWRRGDLTWRSQLLVWPENECHLDKITTCWKQASNKIFTWAVFGTRTLVNNHCITILCPEGRRSNSHLGLYFITQYVVTFFFGLVAQNAICIQNPKNEY